MITWLEFENRLARYDRHETAIVALLAINVLAPPT
jgi:hypothetical protein